MSKLVCTECGSEDVSEFTRNDVDLFCEACCPEHDFQHPPMTGSYHCIHCGKPSPDDFGTWVD